MELIDRKKAIEAILDLPNCPNGFSDMYDKERIISELEEVPTVDAVEVVRCKDCKYCFVDGDDDWRYNVCYFSCNKAQGDDWFCADGKRREADETD